MQYAALVSGFHGQFAVDSSFAGISLSVQLTKGVRRAVNSLSITAYNKSRRISFADPTEFNVSMAIIHSAFIDNGEFDFNFDSQ
jgi:hypothetical protein